MEYFALKSFWILTSEVQIALISVLFILTTILQHRYFQKTGKMFENYPASVSILFAPIYEEVLFRGFILYGLMNLYSTTTAIIVSSLLFGIWHFKNIFWVKKTNLIYQMAYTGLILGPVMALVTIWSGTIWPAVILHYINNLVSPLSKKVFIELLSN